MRNIRIADRQDWVVNQPTPKQPRRHQRLTDSIATLPILLLIPALVLVAFPVAAGREPALHVRSTTVESRDRIVIRGTGFPRGGVGVLTWGEDGDELRGFKVDRRGRFRVAIRIPREEPGSSHELVALLVGQPVKADAEGATADVTEGAVGDAGPELAEGETIALAKIDLTIKERKPKPARDAKPEAKAEEAQEAPAEAEQAEEAPDAATEQEADAATEETAEQAEEAPEGATEDAPDAATEGTAEAATEGTETDEAKEATEPEPAEADEAVEAENATEPEPAKADEAEEATEPEADDAEKATEPKPAEEDEAEEPKAAAVAAPEARSAAEPAAEAAAEPEDTDSAAPAAQAPFGGNAALVPGRVELEHYDAGGAGTAYHDLDAANNGGALRDEAVDIKATDGHTVGWIQAGEWLESTVKITAGTYDIRARVASPTAGGKFHLELDGNPLGAPATIPATNSWNSQVTIVVAQGVTLPAGTHVLRFEADSNGTVPGYTGDVNWIEIGTPTAPAATPTQAAPTQAAPTQAAPTQAAPTQAAPTQAAPTQAAPTQAAPTQAAPTQAAPTQAAPAQAPFGGNAALVPGRVELEHYDAGGAGTAYHDLDAANNGGALRDEAVDIKATDGHTVGWIQAGEWLESTVKITAGTYDIRARVASPTAGGKFHLELDGNPLGAPATIPATNSWNSQVTIVVAQGVTLPAGTHVLRFEADSNGTVPGYTGDVNWIEIGTPTAPAATPTQAAPTQAAPTQAAPTQAAPTQAAPTQAAPTQAAPTQAAPTQAAPTQAAPTQAAPAQAPFGGNAALVPGRVELEHYDAGGAGTAYHDLDAANNGGALRDEAVDIKATDGHTVGWIQAGEWLESTVKITAGTYDIRARVASPTAGGKFHLELDGNPLGAPATIPATNSWNSQVTIVVAQGVTLPAGTHVLRFEADSGTADGYTGDVNWIEIGTPVAPAATPAATPTPAAPTPTPTPPPAPAGSCVPSLQQAINNTPTGGTLVLGACTFRESVNVNRSMTIRGPATIDAQGSRQSWMTINANDVTIDGLTMKNAAAGGTQSTSLDVMSSDRVTIRNVNLSGGSYSNVRFWNGSDDGVVEDSFIHHGRALGIHSWDSDRLTLRRNRIYDNNLAQVGDPGWESGGVKLALGTGFVFADNEVYNNLGPGLWCDVDCRNTTFTGNRVHHNTHSGIFFEISDGALISGNSLWENGWGWSAWGYGASIQVSSSRNVVVRNNTVAWSSRGISVIAQDRGAWPSTAHGSYDHIVVEDNVVVSSTGTWMMNWVDDRGGQPLLSAAGNVGRNNAYWSSVGEARYERFNWGSSRDTLASFNATPGEEGGRYLTVGERDSELVAAGIPTSR